MQLASSAARPVEAKEPGFGWAFCSLLVPALSPNEPIWCDALCAKLDVQFRKARHDRVPPISDTGSPAFRTAIVGSFGPAQGMRRLARPSRRRAYATARAAGGRRLRVRAP